MDRINVAASYVLGLCMESLRRSTIAQLTPRRNMELASYFTFCVKIPEHHLLVLRSALHVAKTSGFVDCVKTLSKKILDMNPGPDVVQKVHSYPL